MKLSTAIFVAAIIGFALAGELITARTDQDIHDFLTSHTEGQGIIYYMVPGQEIDQDSLNLLTQSVDVLLVDGTIPEFVDNV